VLEGPPEQFAVERQALSGERARVYVNLSGEVSAAPIMETGWVDFEGHQVGRRLELRPWSSVWLRND